MSRTLYGLILADGTFMSPYVWRSRFALAHKGLPAELEGLGFTDIPDLRQGAFRTVPVLDDGGTWVADSWSIADHLDAAYPDRPSLFPSPAERAMARLFERWLAAAAAGALFRIAILDIYNRVRPADRDYFRTSREARIGCSMEAFAHDRRQHLAPLRQALAPVRTTVAETPFLAAGRRTTPTSSA